MYGDCCWLRFCFANLLIACAFVRAVPLTTLAFTPTWKAPLYISIALLLTLGSSASRSGASTGLTFTGTMLEPVGGLDIEGLGVPPL